MINNYSLGTTLGTGFSAKVKLAKDQNNSDVALKIFDLNNPMVDRGLLDLVKTEFQATQSMDHRNIVKYYEYCEKAEYVKKDGKEKVQVAYIAMEPILGGELFEYVDICGPFDEKMSRYFFK